jgi:dihydroflavonol-4-reductase
MRHVLVTGGSGFIGRHVVAALLKRGAAVRVLDLADGGAPDPRVDEVRASVLDEPAVRAAVDGVDTVFHLAGIAHLWRRDPADFDRVNRGGTEVVLRAAVRGGARVVHCSTESILLPTRRRGMATVHEGIELSLADMPGPYTRSKHLAEQAALQAARRGANVTVVNPTVPIGDGDRNMTPPAAMFALFLEGGSPAFLDCMLNLVDVRDVAEGFIAAAERGRPGERYIIGGDNIRLGDILRRLEALTGRRMPKRRIPSPIALAAGAVAEFVAARTGRPPAATREAVAIAIRSAAFDCGKARRELGYAPRPIDEALRRAVDWLQERRRSPYEIRSHGSAGAMP